MANKTSCASQAIKDMLEANINVAFFVASINEMHSLNSIIGIVTKDKPRKYPKKPKFIKVETTIKVTTKIKVDRDFHINPDGTISFGKNDWDFD